ncbi:MAG: HEAT repeat domain-containing protein [Methylococcales bacterium]|nr:HEAT repeat domain-containing protein [Methylococcales bacterium]
MNLYYCRKGLTLSFILSLTGYAQITAAEVSANISDKGVTDLVVSEDKGTELQLEVRDTPLAKVLESIAHKTKVPIHYSVLPEGLVTATCVGSSLKPVLECLLDHKADLIVRYRHDPDKTDNKEQVAEAWILGARLDGATAKKDCLAASPGTSSLSLKQKESEDDDETDQTDELIKAAQAKDPTERAEAIGGLLSGGREGDPAVKAVLEQALTDPDENVRAQAISSLAHREGSGASAAIQEALNDKSVDVRMMAVDGITDDKALLQQAINDSDETVRSLARVKLEELTQADKTAP